ncbi:gephyrin-like molybdotransferase Glp [Pseudahrensia aquimaris]|uniref:Molybdopterin molybdenumtransferase n=1 Tax=Pseudahrensia aquimaris TaxID=744461 RepID=A0ABW3FHR6_9HYPH
MNEPRLINDCFLHDQERLRHHEAVAILRANLSTVVGTETINSSDALGRVLAQDIIAPHAVPLHRNAAVDGYAFAHVDLVRQRLPISNKIAAGDTAIAPLKAGTAVRIFTGAPMPNGADSVAMQEDCTTDVDFVTLPLGLKSGANCRLAGEDLEKGDVAVEKGTRLRPVHAAALASVGAAQVAVYKKLRVTLLSSGNELRTPGDQKGELITGEVWDTNAAMLRGLLAALPVELVHQSIIQDNEAVVRNALELASTKCDLIITTGGASRGQEDHMLSCLDALGKRHLWQLAIKPGRPMMFGQIQKVEGSDCLYLGLPGNPVAAFVCFLLYGREMVLRLAGANPQPIAAFMVPANFEITSKKPDRREFLRGVLTTNETGELAVERFPRDGSGLISSLTQSHGLIEIDEETTSLNRGTPVRFLPYSSFD